MKDFHPISSLIKANIAGADDPPAENSIQSELGHKWLRCAGRAAPWSHPLLFSSGRLVIFTQSPIWSTELRHHMQQILKGLDGFGITRIDIRISPGSFPAASKHRKTNQISESSRKGLALTASGLNHPGMRDAMIRLSRKRGN